MHVGVRVRMSVHVRMSIYCEARENQENYRAAKNMFSLSKGIAMAIAGYRSFCSLYVNIKLL